jgi:hypothetical protein
MNAKYIAIRLLGLLGVTDMNAKYIAIALAGALYLFTLRGCYDTTAGAPGVVYITNRLTGDVTLCYGNVCSPTTTSKQ